jgi:Zn-dependent metalloprotease
MAVFIYSGIPNKAFYLLSTALGGYSWEKAGKIWYATLLDNRFLRMLRLMTLLY